MSGKIDAGWATMELRWLDVYRKDSMIHEPIRHLLQQKWVSGDEEEWRDVPTYTEER